MSGESIKGVDAIIWKSESNHSFFSSNTFSKSQTRLNASRMNLTDKEMPDLIELISHMPQLRYLNLSSNNIGKEGATILASFLLSHSHSIVQIQTSENPLRDEGIQALTPLISSHPQIQWTQVREGEDAVDDVLCLQFSNIQCGDAGAKAVCHEIFKLVERKKREEGEAFLLPVVLLLNGNKIREEGANAICEVLEHPNVQVFLLVLCNNKVGESGCERICSSGASLLCLDLDGNKVNEKCLESLRGNLNIVQLEIDLDAGEIEKIQTRNKKLWREKIRGSYFVNIVFRVICCGECDILPLEMLFHILSFLCPLEKELGGLVRYSSDRSSLGRKKGDFLKEVFGVVIKWIAGTLINED